VCAQVRIAVPARERTMRYCESKDEAEQCRFCEKESVTVSMGNLLTFPFVSEAVDKGRVALHGWCVRAGGGTGGAGAAATCTSC